MKSPVKMHEAPLVTVIMPVYNVERYVADSIASILGQTHRYLELLVLNDGSTDGSAAVIRGIQDPRLTFLDSSQNLGVAAQMNIGLARARGTYIARMDSDDIAHPDRLAAQVAYLEAHPAVGVCGAHMNILNQPSIKEHLPTDDLGIRLYMLANSPIANPTVMFRAAVLQAGVLRYDPHFITSEDYRFFAELLPHTQFANLPERLLNYRRHSGQISNYKADHQRGQADEVRAYLLNYYGFQLSAAELLTYCKFVDNYLRPLEASDYGKFKPLMDKLVNQNRQLQALPPEAFEEFIHQTWRTAVYNIKAYSPALVQQLFGTRTRIAQDSLGLVVVLRTLVKGLLSWKVRV